MRSVYLDINNQPVDLPASLKGVFRLQTLVAALQELETRTGEYAWPLTLPFSRRNDAVFGQIRNGAALDKFAGSYTFRLRVGGQQWVGLFRLISLKNGYQGQLIMDGFGWAVALGDKKLTDLTTLPAIPYDGSQLESILSMDCNETDVQFPLVSFGNFFTPPQQQIQRDGSTAEVPAPAGAIIDYPLSTDDYYPSTYYVNVIRAMLREAGYFAQGPVLSDPDVRSWCVTAAGGDQKKWPWGGLLPASASGQSGLGVNSYYRPTNDTENYSSTSLGFDEPGDAGNVSGFDLAGESFFLNVPTPTVGAAPTRALDASRSSYTAPRSGIYTFSWAAALLNGHQTIQAQAYGYSPAALTLFARVAIALVVRRNGAGFGGLATALLAGSPDPDITPSHAYIHSSFNASGNIMPGSFNGTAAVYLDAGDTVSLCVVARRQLIDTPTSNYVLVRREFVINFSSATFACTHYADDDGVSETLLSPVAMLPPLAQKEVMRDFLVRNNALLTTDPESGIATIDFREGHRAAQGPPVDLTGLLNPDDYEPLPVMGSTDSLVFGPADAGDDMFVGAAPGFPAEDTVTISLGSAAAVAGTVKQVTGAFAAIALRSYNLPGGQQAEIPTAASADTLKTARSETRWDVNSTAPRVVRYLGLSGAAVLLPFQRRTLRFGAADYGGALAWAGDAGAVAVRYAESVTQARRGHRLRVPALLSPTRYRELSPGRRVWVGVAEYTVESITGWDCCDEASAAQLELLRVV